MPKRVFHRDRKIENKTQQERIVKKHSYLRNKYNKTSNERKFIKNKTIKIQEIKQQALKHIIAIKKLLKLQNNFFTSTKEERRSENIRKIFHFLGIVIPFMILFFSQKVAILILIVILTPTLIADYNNFVLFVKKVPHSNIILQLFRDYELIKGKLSGFSWLLIGILLSVSVFDKYLASLSVAVLIVCDAVAALIGKNFGRIKLCGAKTFEGTLSFIISGIAISFIFVKYIFTSTHLAEILHYTPIGYELNSLYIGMAIFFSSIVELTAKDIGVDDNFAIPVVFCLTYHVLMILI